MTSSIVAISQDNEAAVVHGPRDHILVTTQEALRAWHQAVAIHGERLDRASAALSKMCDPRYQAPLTEDDFGRAEDEYLYARAAYFALLSALTGQSKRQLEQRVMC
jgi:hypothetical protein